MIIPNPKPLANRTIAVPETRELEPFAGALEELGARVWRCPLVGILDAPDPAPVDCWLHELADGTFHDIVLFTGEGVRRLMKRAERTGMAERARAGFAAARKITRGPKPAKALAEMGLRPDAASAVPTTQGIIDTLRQFELSGRHVGVQLYGTDPNTPLIDFLLDEGAHPEPVAPYIYAPAAHDDSVKDLIAAMAGGSVDMLAFTSATQVKRLVEVAENFQLTETLDTAMNKTKLAAVGPVVADELVKHHWRAAVMPKSSFIWKALLKEIVADYAQG